MGLGSILSIAMSGMAAATRRLEVSASNVANVRSTGPGENADAQAKADHPPAYTPLSVDQSETADGGTSTRITPRQPPQVPGYDPQAPYADRNGMVAVPNVDLTDEAVQQMLARLDLVTNAQVVRAYTQMMKALIDGTR